MKKRLLFALATLSVVFSFAIAPALPVYAVEVLQPVCTDGNANTSEGVPAVCKDQQASSGSNSNPLVGPNGILTVYIRILSIVVAVGAVVMIMVSGLRFITSGSDPQSVASARNGILYAIVGLVVAAFAQGIVTFVIARL